MRIYFVGDRPDTRPNPLAVAAGLDTQRHAIGEKRPLDNRYNAYEADTTYRHVDDPALADFVSNVVDYRFAGVADEARDALATSGKPGIFFDFGDDERPSTPIDGIVYRASLSAKNRLPHERCIGGLALDVRDNGVSFEPLPLEDRPRVAFCGLVTPLLRRLAHRLLSGKDMTSQLLRRRCIKAFQLAREIDTDFIVRSRYLADTTFRNAVSAARLDFLNNLAGSPYALCVRGYGNYSVRFFETLAAGRIPVLIDTDGALPYPEQIPYERHCVIVPLADLASVGKHVARFHETHDADSFTQLQKANRALWDEYFAPPVLIHQAVKHALSAASCTR